MMNTEVQSVVTRPSFMWRKNKAQLLYSGGPAEMAYPVCE